MDPKKPAAGAIDVTVTLRPGLAHWPGEDFWRFEPVVRMSEGAPCNVSKFASGCHLGTHVDAPWHFGEGDERIHQIPLEKMIIPARVIDLTHIERVITRADLEGRIDGARAVLIKSRNGPGLDRGEPFDTEFVHLDLSAADLLVERGVETVGVDYLSVEGFHVQGGPVHHRLLGANVFIVEGLKLTDVAPGDYIFMVLPLKIEGADGAPARAVLFPL